VWAGSSGEAIATVFYNLLSPIGSGIVFFVLLVISLLFLIDRDIQVTIDRIKEKIHSYKARAQEKAGEVVESIQEKAAKKQLEEKQEEVSLTTISTSTPKTVISSVVELANEESEKKLETPSMHELLRASI